MFTRVRMTRAGLGALSALVLGLAGPAGPAITRAAATHHPMHGPAATATFATALAIDQPSGTLFVVGGTFDNQTGGATAPGTLTVLAAGHGTLRRVKTMAVGFGPSSVLVDERRRRVLVLNQGAGNQYTGYKGGSVSMLDLASLEGNAPASTIVARTIMLGRQLPRAMAIDHAAGHALVAGWVLPGSGSFTRPAMGSVSIIDTSTGAVLHTTRLAIVAEAVAVDDATGHAFVLPGMQGPGAALSMVDSRSGALLRSITARTGGQAMAIDTVTGRLFIPTFSGTRASLQVRATSNGALIRTMPTGEEPVAFAVDEPRGRMFAQNVPTAASQGNGLVTMLDARDGTPQGSARVGFPAMSMHVLLGGTPQTLAVDGLSGNLLAANGPKMGTNGPVGPGGSVSIFAPRGRTLRLAHTTAMAGLPVALATDLAGHAYAITMPASGSSTARSHVVMLNARTGATIGDVAL